MNTHKNAGFRSGVANLHFHQDRVGPPVSNYLEERGERR